MKTYIIKKRGGGERQLGPDKYFLDRSTPVGEDAKLYERKPHGGLRYVSWKDVIRAENNVP